MTMLSLASIGPAVDLLMVDLLVGGELSGG